LGYIPLLGVQPLAGSPAITPSPFRGSGVTGVIEVLFDVAVIKMFRAAMMSALNTLPSRVHLNNPRYALTPQPSPCHGHLDEVPEVRGRDRSSGLLGEGDNTGEYWPDGFHNVIASDVDEYYFLCPECGRILFNDIEAAEKFLRGQPITEDDICPEDY